MVDKYYSKRVGNRIGNNIKAISIQYLKDQGVDINCHVCHKPIRAGIKDEFGNKYFENKNIFENSLHSILLVFHVECKKQWVRDQYGQ